MTALSGPFAITQRLVKPVPPGTTYALLQCSTPVCALFTQLLQGATKALGVQLSVVKAGPSVTAQQAAMSSIISEKPAGVVLPGVSGDTTSAQIHQLNQMGIPVVSLGIVNASKYGIKFDTAARAPRCASSGPRCTDGCSATATAPRPVGLDCHFESICESCTYFQTTHEFRPTLERQRDDAASKGQLGRLKIFDVCPPGSPSKHHDPRLAILDTFATSSPRPRRRNQSSP